MEGKFNGENPRSMYPLKVTNYIKLKTLEAESAYFIENIAYNHLIEEGISNIDDADNDVAQLTQPTQSVELKVELRFIYRRVVQIAGKVIQTSNLLWQINLAINTLFLKRHNETTLKRITLSPSVHKLCLRVDWIT